MTELRGITWQHTRGYLPMVATAQRFSELHPDVQIRPGVPDQPDVRLQISQSLSWLRISISL